jgi:hypothetical protein
VNSATNTTGTLQIPTGATLNITHDLTLTGVIDMAGGGMALDNGATQITQFSNWIKNGRKTNTWTGTTNSDGTSGGAINSSLAALTPNNTAVGFAPGSALFSTFSSTFAGKTVFQSTMLVRYTTLGDANVTANTNALDFNTLATNFGKSSLNWYQGDFNYDGSVNTSDFVLLASRFDSSVPTSAAVVDSAGVDSASVDSAVVDGAPLPASALPGNLFNSSPIDPGSTRDLLSPSDTTF